MALFQRKPLTRRQLLEKASRARARRNKKKAVAFYRKALELDEADLDVHAKLAPLLADLRQRDDALKSFLIAADGFRSQGFVDKSIGVYQQATRHFPTESDLWERMAQMNLERSRPQDATLVLLAGSQHFLVSPTWDEAARLLRQAKELEPHHYDVNFALALALSKLGEVDEAIELLEALLPGARRRRLRQLRWRLFRIDRGAGRAWHWLRARLLGR